VNLKTNFREREHLLRYCNVPASDPMPYKNCNTLVSLKHARIDYEFSVDEPSSSSRKESHEHFSASLRLQAF
jgi:hypothetical protein